jgi:predicted transcriptional regulator of viral defense system
MSVAIGQLETRVLAYTQGRIERRLTSGELAQAFGWTPQQERSVLSRLARKGLIVRVRPGLYLTPERMPPGGRFSPGEFLALAELMGDCGGRYQISGPSAFNRYGWTDQVPNRTYAYNDRISGDRQIGTVALTLIKVGDDRLGGIQVVRTPDGIDVVYASKVRALVDAVYDWSRFDTLPRAFDWIQLESAKADTFVAEFIPATIAFGNQGTLRRIGALLENLGAPEPLLRRLEREIHPSSCFIPWIPNRKKRGKVSRRWGVVINDG